MEKLVHSQQRWIHKEISSVDKDKLFAFKKMKLITTDSKPLNMSTQYVFLLIICFVASLGGVLFGFDTAVISGTFGMVESQFGLSKIEVGWFGSAALVGAIAGAFSSGVLSDRFGRKPVLILAAFLFLISAFFSAIPPEIGRAHV